MIKAERQNKIQMLLEARGTVSVKEIADSLGVSDMTVRRDLEDLSRDGLLERVHGGARRISGASGMTLPHEYSHSEKRVRNTDAKLEIARRAVELVSAGQTVFLGTGTTIEQMVNLLPVHPLRIVTNSLSVFNLLENRDDYELCLVGGLYRRRTAAFVGPMAEEAVSSLGIDVAFIGANGILDGAVSTSNMEEGKFQQLVFNMARTRYLVSDSSKFGRRDFYTFYRLEDVTALVCEHEVPDEELAEIAQYAEVITA